MTKNDLKTYDAAFYKRHQFFLESVQGVTSEVIDKTNLYLTRLAVLMGVGGLDLYGEVLAEALKAEVSPIGVKETLYQAVDYLGMGRVYPFIGKTNEVMTAQGVALPLADQTTTDLSDRLEKGSMAQVAIFGPQMKDFWKQGKMNQWLAENCFGDYYTRTGLDLKQRELVTFCYLIAQGGCESQVKSHIFGNLALGNTQDILMHVIYNALPYMGYPRALNAITALNEVLESMKQK